MGKADERRDAAGKAQAAPAAKTADARGGLRAMLLETLGQFAAAPVIGLFAGFLLLFGGIFLSVAWEAGARTLLDSDRYAPFTATTSGRIVESWVAVEFDPADVPAGKLYWEPVSRITPCAVVEYGSDWGAPLRRAFCGNRFQLSDSFRLEDWKTLAPGVPFAFLRDASGFAVEEVRMSKPALEWISAHPPQDTFLLSRPPPTTALGALREQFDQPLEVALASWTKPVPPLPLAYDPHHPQQAMPAALVQDARSASPLGGIIFMLFGAALGIPVWRIGVGMLTGQSGALLWFLALLPLLALPWWGDALPQIVRRANADWARVASDMLDDVTRTTRFSASDRANALLVDGERLVWRVEAGAYADTFGRIRFAVPQPAPASADAALAALRAQAAEQVAHFDSAQRAALFLRLRRQYDAFARDVQPVFTAAAEKTLVDPAADAAAQDAAKQFLILGSGATYYEDQLDALQKAAAQHD